MNVCGAFKGEARRDGDVEIFLFLVYEEQMLW